MALSSSFGTPPLASCTRGLCPRCVGSLLPVSAHLCPLPFTQRHPGPAPGVCVLDTGKDEHVVESSPDTGDRCPGWAPNTGRKTSLHKTPHLSHESEKMPSRQPGRLARAQSSPRTRHSADPVAFQKSCRLPRSCAKTGVMNQLGPVSPAAATEQAPRTCSEACWKRGGRAPLRGNPEIKQSNKPG